MLNRFWTAGGILRGMPTSWMEYATTARSETLSLEEALLGQTLVGVESAGDDYIEHGIASFVLDHFASFLSALRHIAPRQKDLLLGYFVIRASQASLASTHYSTQTTASADIMLAIRNLVAFSLWRGPPNEAAIRKILREAGLETYTCGKSSAYKTVDVAPFIAQALKKGVRSLPPGKGYAPRKILHETAQGLVARNSPEAKALCSLLENLTTRISTHASAGPACIFRVDDPRLGEFRVQIPANGELPHFQSRGTAAPTCNRSRVRKNNEADD